MPPYRFDLLAVFDDPFKALDVVPKIMQAGLNPTSMEYMDNSYVRACADYIEFKGAPHYEDGIYVIITVETFSEDELDMKMEQLDDCARQQVPLKFWKRMTVSGQCAATARNLSAL